MKGNNILANAHFHKDWQFRVKVRLNQAKRKEKRRAVRKAKAAAVAPRPAGGLLRPIVHGQTKRYNAKVRAGRGFTVEELKAAGVSRTMAKLRGVAVDYRRRNTSEESLKQNADRLKSYMSRIVVNPKATVPQLKGPVAKIAAPKPKIEAVTITAEMKSGQAYRKAKQEVASFKLEGKRRFAKEEKKEEKAEASGGGGGDDE